jgi:hypothetical protein
VFIAGGKSNNQISFSANYFLESGLVSLRMEQRNCILMKTNFGSFLCSKIQAHSFCRNTIHAIRFHIISLWFAGMSLTYNHICINHNPTGYEFGRTAANKSAEVLEHNHA